MTGSATEGAALFASALESAAREVLGSAWGCVPDNSAPSASLDISLNASGSALPAVAWHGSALPLSVAGQPHELRLQGTKAVVAGLLPRMLGRAASAEEVDDMAEELLAELANQVAGHLAGSLGEGGREVELGTPAALATSANLTHGPAFMDPTAPVAVTRWTYGRKPLVLSLYRFSASTHE